MKKIALLLVSLFIVSGCAGTSNPQIASQIKASREYFASVPFTALVNFHVHGNHYVDPNGKPLQRDQSKRHGSKGLFTKNYAVAEGEQGHIFSIYLKNDRVLGLSVSKGTGMAAAWNPSNIEVHYARSITEQDLTPQRLARALSSLLVIKNLEPGSELEDLLDDLGPPMAK